MLFNKHGMSLSGFVLLYFVVANGPQWIAGRVDKINLKALSVCQILDGISRFVIHKVTRLSSVSVILDHGFRGCVSAGGVT